MLGVMCEPSECPSYLSALKSYIGMKLFSLLWDNEYTHNWAGDLLIKLLKDHNHGEDGIALFISCVLL
jgi:hypothetical protein